MANKDEFLVEIDTMDVAFLGTKNEIPGDTIDKKILNIVEQELQDIAESILKEE